MNKKKEMIMYDELYGALKTMIRSVAAAEQCPPDMKDENFTKEFRTVKFSVGRQSGHTSVALRLAKEMGAPTLWLCENLNSKNYLRDKVSDNITLCCALSSPVKAMRGKVIPELIIIDPAGCVPDANITTWVNMFSRFNPIVVLVS